MSKTLSIFCDESGDFGMASKHSPYYIVGFIFHDQSNSVQRDINLLNQSVVYCDTDCRQPIHTYPIIRNEYPYNLISFKERRKLFNSLVAFYRHVNVKSDSVVVDKRNAKDAVELENLIRKTLVKFVDDITIYLNTYDKIVLYYDNGQPKLRCLLEQCLSTLTSNVELRKIKPKDYVLFQAADLVCTLELINVKFPKLSNSEIKFFGDYRSLKKNYLNLYKKKRLFK